MKEEQTSLTQIKKRTQGQCYFSDITMIWHFVGTLDLSSFKPTTVIGIITPDLLCQNSVSSV